MPIALYDLPNWLLGLVVTGTWVAIGLTGYFLFRAIVRREFEAEEKNIAIELLAVIATVNSLLLAFSAVSVWEAFGAADEAVHSEANTITELSQDLAVFESAKALHARELVRAYTRTVLEDEWPAMQDGTDSDEAWAVFDDLFRAVGALEPMTPGQVALMPEIWARTNELLKQRRERIYTSEARVPGTLWLVVIVGTLLTIGTLYVLPPTPYHISVIMTVAGAMGLVFFFVVGMDRPFAGNESISPGPFEVSLENMDRWDAETAALSAR